MRFLNTWTLQALWVTLTAIPVFIGHTEIAKEKIVDDLRMKEKRITSMLEYETYFGFAQNEENPTEPLEMAGKFSPMTATFNISGQPAASVPIHWNADGLPIGVQLEVDADTRRVTVLNSATR